MIRAAVLACVLSAGCGRIGFDLLAGDDVAGDDQIVDAAPGSGFDLPDFSPCPPPSLLVLVGDAECIGDVLRLTPDETGRSGGAWYAVPIDFSATTEIELHVELRVSKVGSPSPNGEGMAVVIHDAPAGTGSLGSGAILGYGGLTPSSGFEIDPLDNGGTDSQAPHFGFIVDGVAGSTRNIPFDIVDGGSFHLWVDYNVGDEPFYAVATAESATRPGFNAIAGIDDLARLGSSRLWIGFVAGTSGTAAEAHEIVSWQLAIR